MEAEQVVVKAEQGVVKPRGLVLVGEVNPYATHPSYALYCVPRGSAGERLQRLVLALEPDAYLALPRYNLCERKWSAPQARKAAAEILQRHANETCDDVIVLLGRKVVEAFYGGPEGCPQSDWPEPFTTDHMAYAPLGGHETAAHSRKDNLVILPHPSGLCRAWAEPGAFQRARDLVNATLGAQA